jgi:hypothetical protein
LSHGTARQQNISWSRRDRFWEGRAHSRAFRQTMGRQENKTSLVSLRQRQSPNAFICVTRCSALAQRCGVCMCRAKKKTAPSSGTAMKDVPETRPHNLAVSSGRRAVEAALGRSDNAYHDGVPRFEKRRVCCEPLTLRNEGKRGRRVSF